MQSTGLTAFVIYYSGEKYAKYRLDCNCHLLLWWKVYKVQAWLHLSFTTLVKSIQSTGLIAFVIYYCGERYTKYRLDCICHLLLWWKVCKVQSWLHLSFTNLVKSIKITGLIAFVIYYLVKSFAKYRLDCICHFLLCWKVCKVQAWLHLSFTTLVKKYAKYRFDCICHFLLWWKVCKVQSWLHLSFTNLVKSIQSTGLIAFVIYYSGEQFCKIQAWLHLSFPTLVKSMQSTGLIAFVNYYSGEKICKVQVWLHLSFASLVKSMQSTGLTVFVIYYSGEKYTKYRLDCICHLLLWLSSHWHAALRLKGLASKKPARTNTPFALTLWLSQSPLQFGRYINMQRLTGPCFVEVVIGMIIWRQCC